MLGKVLPDDDAAATDGDDDDDDAAAADDDDDDDDKEGEAIHKHWDDVMQNFGDAGGKPEL